MTFGEIRGLCNAILVRLETAQGKEGWLAIARAAEAIAREARKRAANG